MKELILKRNACSDSEADMIVNDLSHIDPKLKETLDRWIRTETVDHSVVVEGYTVEKLMSEFDMKFTGAVLTLDWLIKDPAEAKKALSYGFR